ncbi:MAG: serine hydrolase domain-containing protein, partial [Pseudomonadota bacterium]
TSGLTYSFNPGLLAEAYADKALEFEPDQGTLGAMCTQVAELPLAFAPGQKWEYSISIDVLGRVAEVVTGKSLEQVFQENILDPLNMAATGFRVPQRAGDGFASLYTPLAGRAMGLNDSARGTDPLRLVDDHRNSPFLRSTLFSGGGGLVGTIDDYMRFAEMLRSGGAAPNGRLLGPQTLSFMMRNHLAGDIASMGPSSFAEQPMDGMGFGLGGAVVLDPARARTPGSIGDFSWGGMASTFFWVDPMLDLSVVFFTQLSPSSSYPSRAQLKALVQACLA